MAERVRNQERENDEILRSVHAQALNVQSDLVSVCLEYWGKLFDLGGRETRRGVSQSDRRFLPSFGQFWNVARFSDLITSCVGLTFTPLDQLRELFNQFSPLTVRLSTVNLSVYQSISCLYFSIVVSTKNGQSCISFSSIGRTDLHQLYVCVLFDQL